MLSLLNRNQSQKQIVFSDFLSHTIHLLAFLGHFTNPNEKKAKSLPFHIPENWKRYSFRAQPPRISHHREYPPGIGDLTKHSFVPTAWGLRSWRFEWYHEKTAHRRHHLIPHETTFTLITYSLPRCGQCFWLVALRGKFALTNQLHYPYLSSDTSSVWNF